MSGLNLDHPNICILHTGQRLADAKSIAQKYRKLGAVVALKEIASGNATRHHKGRLYYFNQENPRFGQIAKIIANDLSATESLRTRYLQLFDAEFDFAIYIVTVKVCVTKVHCPKCNCQIREDRLDEHLIKPHPKVKKVKKGLVGEKSKIPAKKKKLVFLGKGRVSNWGQLLGQPGVSSHGSGSKIKKLRPRLGLRLCRICNTIPAMYNGGECYSCNPK